MKTVHKASKRNRKISLRATESAQNAVGMLEPGIELYGLTMGQFSLIDLILAVLRQTGPALRLPRCLIAGLRPPIRSLSDWVAAPLSSLSCGLVR